MFIGLILAILIIVGYAMYVSNKYVLKGDFEKLAERISKLEETQDPVNREKEVENGSESISRGDQSGSESG